MNRNEDAIAGIRPALLWMGLLGVGAAIPPNVGVAGSLLALCPPAVTNFSHVLGYGLLTWLLASALKERGCPERMALLLAMAAAMVFGLSMEVMQGFVPGRIVDGGDVLFNAFGIGGAALMIRSASQRGAYAYARRSLRAMK